MEELTPLELYIRLDELHVEWYNTTARLHELEAEIQQIDILISRLN